MESPTPEQSANPDSRYLQNELGPGNWIEKTAKDALLIGRQYRDTDLEAASQKLAQMILDIPYDSDKFYTVRALAKDIGKEIEIIKSLDAHEIQTLNDPEDISEKPWKYIFERYSDGFRIILDKWNTTYDEMDRAAALIKFKIEKMLDDYINIESLRKQEKIRDHNAYYYEDINFINPAEQILKISQFHKHGSGNIGFRSVYNFPDENTPERDVRALWAQIQKIIQNCEYIDPTSTSPRLWEYHTGERITIPKDSELIEAAPETGLKLYYIPNESFRLVDDSSDSSEIGYTLNDALDQSSYAFAITNKQNKVALMMIADTKVKSFKQLKNMIRAFVGIVDNSNYSITDYRKIPAIYDENNRWLVFPVSKGTSTKLKDTHKSGGNSGTHYRVNEINVFVNALCMGKKIEDITHGDWLRKVQYLDLRKAHDGKVYIDADAQRLAGDVAAGLEILGIFTSNQLPLFMGEGSLLDALKNITGKLDHPYFSKYELVNILRESLSGVDRHFENYSIDNYFWQYFLEKNTNKNQTESVEQAAQNTSSNYGIHGGIPAAAILIHSGTDNKNREIYKIIISGDHPNAEKEANRHYKKDFIILARLDGIFRLRPPHGQSSKFNFDYYLTDVTDRRGMNLSEDNQTVISQLLKEIAKGSRKDMENEEDGICVNIELLT